MQNLNTNEVTKLELNWRELIVCDETGAPIGDTLGELVAIAPANLDNAELDNNGALAAWPGFFLAEEDVDPTDENGFETLDSSRVNWDGLREALGR